MGGCGALSRLITKRHDEALNLIFIELKKRNPEWTFELEPRPAANVANHKPDLCATHRQSQSVVIMDFTVRTESTSQLKMAFLQEMKQWTVFHVMLGITFIVSGIILNLLQLILYVLVRPFNKDTCRKINFYLLYFSWSQLVALSEWWSGTVVNMYTLPENVKYIGKEHAVLTMNHKYDIEWLMGWVIGERFNVLGNCRVYAKKVLKYIPIIGWGWALSDMIFLDRDWTKDCQNLIQNLQELYSYVDNVWILIFCEGTRFTKEKHEASLKFAKERGLPLLKHHLLPRTKGFVFSVKNLKGKFPALYDVTIGFSPKFAEPTMQNLLYGRKMQADLYVRRIPLEDIPTETEEACAKYLFKLYEEKDELLDTYFKTGKFPFPCEPLKVEHRPYTLINLIFWACLILIPSGYYTYQALVYGSFVMKFITVGIVATFYFCTNKLIGISMASKSSSYGTIGTSKESVLSEEKKSQ
ncbi:1-acyl-sn-glycerol-3-phosphate acyltransferase gamma [Nymphon striatum]|nr:1-acyl-sn-glycerol-3-phosphate acyltransferase gamma [Nymphon striatum]